MVCRGRLMVLTEKEDYLYKYISREFTDTMLPLDFGNSMIVLLQGVTNINSFKVEVTKFVLKHKLTVETKHICTKRKCTAPLSLINLMSGLGQLDYLYLKNLTNKVMQIKGKTSDYISVKPNEIVVLTTEGATAYIK